MKKLRCVALVDDNPADNFLHRRVIARAGIAERVEAFEDPQGALDLLRDRQVRPELILLDINMPGLTGWEFLEAYESFPDEARSAIVVIMLTTSARPEDEDRAVALGVLGGFLTKPLTVEMCREIMDRHFSEA